MKKGYANPSFPLCCTWFCSTLFHINTFSISVAPPLQEPLCWCTKHDECQARSAAVKPLTSHQQEPDNISYCLPVCTLASLQCPVYNPSSSASEPKKTSLMQFCCNISPLPVADTILKTTVTFLLRLRWRMLLSSELKDSQTHPESPSHEPHPMSWDHKQSRSCKNLSWLFLFKLIQTFSNQNI